MRYRAELRPVLAFYGLAILISWIAWSPLVLGQNGLKLLPFAVPMPWTIAGTLGPPLAAMLMWHRAKGGIGAAMRRLIRPSLKGMRGAVTGTFFVGVTFVLGAAVLLSRDPPHGWQASALSLYGFHLITTLLGGPVFEEWGWRGFAQPRLQSIVGPLPAALIIGLGWGLWHLPLFLVPGWSSASVPYYVVMVMALSVVMAWGFNASGGWIIAAIAMHFTYNASSRVLGGFLGDAPLRSWPDPVTAILLSFVTAALLVILLTRGRLAASALGVSRAG